ncbi:MAG TPA: nucleoside hydrolase [Arachnia sp.]|nr:nucleoside hydrolase [Arachnia sp.]
MTRVPTGAPTYDVPLDKRWRLGETPWRDAAFRPHARVLIDNDFSGDPDDLYQIVHHLLSPSLDIRGVICSHLRPGDPWDLSDDTAANALAVAADVFARMGLESTELLIKGAALPLVDRETPQDSAAARAIVAEAMREDTDQPLFYVAGGGLTDLASAYLIEPAIASRMILVWIGGLEHDGLAAPPRGAMSVEYNLRIDIAAGQVLFDAPEFEIWQIPRDVYRQCLVTETELRRRVAATGPLGRYLYDEIRYVMDPDNMHKNDPMPESYALGDSPLVLLTALRSAFEPDSTSSRHVLKPTPQITADGTYRPMSGTRSMRVYTQVDVRLMFEDFYVKLEEFAEWQAS